MPRPSRGKFFCLRVLMFLPEYMVSGCMTKYNSNETMI